jgi:predicted DNA-binding protein YlxM (UPF0122 family)
VDQDKDSVGQGDQNSAQTIDRAVRIVRLMDLYGPLLTDRQRDFVRLHFEEDLSFGEIAREHGISRQAVHDAVKHAEKSLEEYESKLEFSTGRKRRPVGGTSAENMESAPSPRAASAAPVAGIDPVIGLLEAIHEKLRRSGGVIYNADGITRDLGDVIDRLRQLKAE